MSDLPVLCTLSGEQLRARREGDLSALVKLARNCEWLPDGVRLEFAPTSETLSTMTRIVDAERQCCRFLRFEFVVEPDDGAMTLAVTGSAGAREFLKSLFP